MNNIILGKTNIQISKQGLGCMGMSEFYGEADNKNSEEVILKAVEKGISFFDTADVYNFGENEKLVGSVLKSHPKRKDLVIATKCGILRDKNDPTVRGIDNTPSYIKEACERSLKNLDTHIDLYYIHRVKEENDSIKKAMQAMAELLEQGKIRSVGLSEVTEKALRYAHACLLEFTGGKQGISALQTEYSLFTRSAQDNGVLDACRELGITFVAYSPISRGLLTTDFNMDGLENNDFRKTLPRFQQENLEYNYKLTQEIHTIAQDKKCSVPQLALAWLMYQENVVPIPGTKRLKYIIENADASNVNLSEDEYNQLNQISKKFKVKGQRYTENAMKSYGFDE